MLGSSLRLLSKGHVLLLLLLAPLLALSTSLPLNITLAGDLHPSPSLQLMLLPSSWPFSWSRAVLLQILRPPLHLHLLLLPVTDF